MEFTDELLFENIYKRIYKIEYEIVRIEFLKHEIDKEKDSNYSTLIAIAVLDYSVAVNNICIEVKNEYRGNGYGKEIFKVALQEYINNFGYKNLHFTAKCSNHRFINILLQNNAIQCKFENNMVEFILPLGKWEETEA